MVRLHPGPLATCPDTPTGRATRLKPECLQVRVLLWVLMKQRLGRQLADHLGLEPGMLWVRLPPEPLQHITSSWSSQECSPPCHVETVGSNPIGDADIARYANRQSGQAQTLVSVGSTPTRATETCVGWALAGPAGCNPVVPAWRFNSVRRTDIACDVACSEAFISPAGSIPVPTDNTARSSNG